MKCSEIDPRTLHQQRGSLVKKVMDSVQEHCPNFDEPLYRCLQSPDEWLNDHVLVQFVKHLQHGMPVPDQAVSDVVFGPGFFDFKLEGKNKIDFGEVCILDTHTAWQIGQAHLSSDCEAVSTCSLFVLFQTGHVSIFHNFLNLLVGVFLHVFAALAAHGGPECILGCSGEGREPPWSLLPFGMPQLRRALVPLSAISRRMVERPCPGSAREAPAARNACA
jgi:hypothetical protein